MEFEPPKTKLIKIELRDSYVYSEHYKSSLLMASRIMVALCSKSIPSDRVLAYMIHYSHDGNFFIHNGTRKIMLDRLRISKKQYETAMSVLKTTKLIKRGRNANGSQYIFYELNDLAKSIAVSEKYMDLVFKL